MVSCEPALDQSQALSYLQRLCAHRPCCSCMQCQRARRVTCVRTQVLLRLQAVLDSFAQAGDDEDLVFLTRLIQLACSARAVLKHGGSFPPASQGLITRLYPALMAACLADAATYTGTAPGRDAAEMCCGLDEPAHPEAMP